MADYFKYGSISGSSLFREVEPVTPYPRINPHQPKRDEYPRQQNEQDSGTDDRSRRRFTLMREFIEKLKETSRIARLDYATAEVEMHNLGLAIAEELLISQLLQLKVSLSSIDELFQQIRQQNASLILAPGRPLTDGSFPLFPVSAAGLTEYSLVFSNLQIRPNRQESRIAEEISAHGRFISDADRLRLTIRALAPAPAPSDSGDPLQLDIQILVGAIELDEGGRRAIIYPRSKTSCGLYADKQINLSI